VHLVVCVIGITARLVFHEGKAESRRSRTGGWDVAADKAAIALELSECFFVSIDGEVQRGVRGYGSRERIGVARASYHDSPLSGNGNKLQDRGLGWTTMTTTTTTTMRGPSGWGEAWRNIPFELVGKVASACAVAEAGDVERGAAAARHCCGCRSVA